jgi:predicted nucleotidyltransferase
MRELKVVARQIKTDHPEVQKALLFGSLARGDAVPGSDADLLLILSSSSHSFLERIPQYLPPKVSLPVDVFPYTRVEIDRMLAEGNHFIKRAMKEGIELA